MNGFFTPKGRSKVLGHRGNPKAFQENTLAGFQSALEAGADGVELDVFLTRDEKVVVFHDEDIGRLTGVPGQISEMTWDEISQLRIQKTIDRGDGTQVNYASEQPIPLLEEVLSELPSNFLINIEMKAYAPKWSRRHTGTKVAEIIRQTDSLDRVIATSFDFFMLEYLEREFPEVHTGFTYDGGMLGGFGDWLQRFVEVPSELALAEGNQNHHTFLNFLLEHNVIGRFVNSTAVGAEHVLIDSDTVEKFHEQNMLVGAYTLFPEDTRFADDLLTDHESEAHRLSGLGVDWIETDDPKRLLEILS